MSKAKARYIRISPRKVRMVANILRGKGVAKALELLGSSKKRAADVIEKLIRSAMSNAENKGGVDLENLYVKELTVDAGPVLKRSLPRARGMATPILKRTSHIGVVLEEK